MKHLKNKLKAIWHILFASSYFVVTTKGDARNRLDYKCSHKFVLEVEGIVDNFKWGDTWQ